MTDRCPAPSCLPEQGQGQNEPGLCPGSSSRHSQQAPRAPGETSPLRHQEAKSHVNKTRPPVSAAKMGCIFIKVASATVARLRVSFTANTNSSGARVSGSKRSCRFRSICAIGGAGCTEIILAECVINKICGTAWRAEF